MNLKKILVFVTALVLSAAALASPQFLYIKKSDNSIVQLKDTDGNPVTTILNHFQGGIYYVSSYGAKCDGTTDDTSAIQSAINAANSAGGAAVVLPAATCYIPGGLALSNGVSLIGRGFILDSAQLGNLSGGTILLGNNTNPCISFNATDGTLPQLTYAQLFAARVNNVAVVGMGLKNCTYGIKVGSLYNTGAFNGLFKNLYVQGASQWGYYFENTSESIFNTLSAVLPASGALGGFYYGGSQTNYNHGNSSFRRLYVDNGWTLPATGMARGIVFQARAGTKLNDLTATDIQTNQNRPTLLSQVASMTASSANIGVTDSTKYPIDLPVSFDAAAGGFNKYQTYFVVSSAANVITLSDKMRGTARSSNATTSAAHVQSYGWPNLEIVGLDVGDAAGNLIQPSTFTGLDLEGYATTNALVQNAEVHLDIGTLETGNQGTINASTLTGRGTVYGTWRASQQITAYDIDSAYQNFFALGVRMPLTSNATTCVQACPVGFLFNSDSLAAGFNFNGVTNLQKGLNLEVNYTNAAGNILYPFIAMGQHVSTRNNTAYTLTALDAGAIDYTGTTLTTWTLPTLVGGAGGTANTTAGMDFEITNASTSAVNLTIACGGTDNFNRNAAKTSYVLPQGASIHVRAQYDGTSTYWKVIAASGFTYP